MSLYDEINTQVFEDSDKLRASYIPDDVIERNEQAKDVIAEIQPITMGSQPDHPFLIGQHGTGKTLVSRYVVDMTVDRIEELNEDRPQEEQIEPATAFINCESESTVYNVALKITNSLLPEGEEIKQGYSKGRLYDRMAEAIDQAGDVVLLILDEVGDVEGINSLFYQITRQGDSSLTGDTPLAVISTANEFTFEEKFDSDVLSSADTGAKVRFPTYNANQLRKIIDQRVDGAFASGAVEESGRARLAAIVAKRHNGDARHAMKVLMTAGKMATKEAGTTIDNEFIDRAADKLEEDVIREKVNSLPDTATHILTGFLINVAQEYPGKVDDKERTASGNESGIPGGDVLQSFAKVRNNLDLKPSSKPTYYRHLNLIEDSGLIRRQKKTGESWDYYWSEYPATQIAEAIINDSDCEVDAIAGY